MMQQNNGQGGPPLKANYTDPIYLTKNPSILFTVGTALGALSCFSRADYNLPFFAFLAVMWNQDDVS